MKTMLTHILLYTALIFSVGCIKKTDCGLKIVTKKVEDQKGMVIQEVDSYYIYPDDESSAISICNYFPSEFKKDSLKIIYTGRYLHRTNDPRVRYASTPFFLDEIEIY